jgi:acyl transferase domain-containing protein
LDEAVAASAPMLGHARGIDTRGELTFETELDPKLQPFLYDHQIEGTPVLPGVMGIEAFAEAALRMAPGWHIAAIEDVHFLAPFKFYRQEPRTLRIHAGFHMEDAELVADCRLTGQRRLPNQPEPQSTTHFTARIRMSRQAPALVTAPQPETIVGSPVEAANIYRLYFHGPAYQVLKRAWWAENRAVGEMSEDLPANHIPAEQPLAAAPRLIELCFQTAGLLEMAVDHRMGLPHHVDRIAVSPLCSAAKGPLKCAITAGPTRESFDAEVVDGDGNRCVLVSGYSTVVFRDDVTPEALQHREAAVRV